MTYGFYLLAIFLVTLGCPAQPASTVTGTKVFEDYWYQGKAEISTYDVAQHRYDSVHEGQAIMIFVTEDIHRKHHVKLDDPVRFQKEAIKVLKLNLLNEFVTGIYKYSLMTSVFTPVNKKEEPHSLKVTFSSQDWCGHDFYQYNWKGNRYEVLQHSYFESTADKSFSLMNPWLEDEVWTRIRIDPANLQTGKLKIVPSSSYVRLHHVENKVYEAEGMMANGREESYYRLTYPSLQRDLTIWFESSFPFKILRWEENNNGLITKGKLKTTLIDDYWYHHFPKDTVLRNKLLQEN